MLKETTTHFKEVLHCRKGQSYLQNQKANLFGTTFKKSNTDEKMLLIHLLFSFSFNLRQQNKA